MPESVISHYRILEKVGSGGMGVVYKAEDTQLRRTVALKFLPPDLSSDPEAGERFLREARAASALDHPNICTVYEVGQGEDGQLFISMAYYEGMTLKEKIAQGRLTVKEAGTIAMQVARGLAEAHAHNMVHRDIKPANIFVTKGNIAKILDFGLAKLHGDMALTRPGSTLGTVAYMSPEQTQGLDTDERTDLWALGVILYEMLAGTRPFKGDHEAAVMYEVLNSEPQPLTLVRSDVPQQVSDLISHLLKKDPSKRISSADAVIQALETALAPKPVDRTEPEERSVAVLYFENMSPDKENDYFCAGIADDIITDLSKIKELRVLSRSDVLPFRNKEVNTREVGRTLRVSHVLEGSVRKAGTRVRITAQLMDVRTGFHIWAERFDRMLEDIFDVQNEVSSSIARALRVSLTEAEKKSLAQRPTDDLRAHDFYLRGLDFLFKRGKKNTFSAIQMFENALTLDRNYVSAYAGLGDAYSNLFIFYDGDSKWLAKIIEINEKLLAVDPSAVEARFGMGMVSFHQKRFNEARKMLSSVIAEQPDHYDANRFLGVIADLTGDYEAAITHYKRCVELKPFSEEPWMHLDMTYRRVGNLDLSIQAAQRGLELGEAKVAVNPDDAITLSRISGYYVRLNRNEEALEAVRRVREIDPTDGLALYNCACTYATIGERDQAMKCLRDAFANGYGYVREWVKTDPDFAQFRDDPEFKAFVAEGT
jgi:serine/threonine protein kinase/Flp pilus assembly protein TadD